MSQVLQARPFSWAHVRKVARASGHTLLSGRLGASITLLIYIILFTPKKTLKSSSTR
jgi:hypothetical protein